MDRQERVVRFERFLTGVSDFGDASLRSRQGVRPAILTLESPALLEGETREVYTIPGVFGGYMSEEDVNRRLKEGEEVYRLFITRVK